LAILFTVLACGLAGAQVIDPPQWVQHAPVPAVVTYLVIVAAALIWGCFRGWRIGLGVDEDGVTVRNFFRTHRFGWPEVSCFADGSAFGGQSEHWWALRVVLRDGRAVTARGTTRSGPPTPKTLAAIRQAAERYQIPAELTGTVMRRGLYADPGGHAGSRYWDGREWSPLLPADHERGEPPPKFPAQVSSLPEADGNWRYAASRAKRASVVFAVSAAASVLLLAGALGVDLWWDQSNHHKHYSSVSLFFFAGMSAFLAFGSWSGRKRFIKLDKAARGALPTGTGERQQDAVVQARRAGIAFAVLLAATTLTLVGSWVLFLWGSNHHNNYGPSSLVFCAGLFGLIWTWSAWERRKGLRRISQGDTAAAGPTGPNDSTDSPADRG
jgi:hypothetical protein